MTFITILVSLILERLVSALQDWRRHNWFHTLYIWLQKRFADKTLWNGPVGVVLVLVVPVALVAIVSQLLHEVWLELFTFLFSIAVLLLCLGPRDLDEDVETYLEARESGDDDKARTAASAVLGREADASEQLTSRSMVEAIVVQANERIFSVLFWYAVLGPVGAVLFRLSCLLRNEVAAGEGEPVSEGLQQAAARLHGILIWLPARITALGFGIAGSFEDALHNWRNRSAEWNGEWVDSSNGVLSASGLGALQLEADAESGETDLESELATVRAGLGLVWRTLIAWVTLFALMTLAGWAG